MMIRIDIAAVVAATCAPATVVPVGARSAL